MRTARRWSVVRSVSARKNQRKRLPLHQAKVEKVEEEEVELREAFFAAAHRLRYVTFLTSLKEDDEKSL